MQILEAYGKAHAQILDALKQYPKEMWQFKPSPSSWSIHEIIVHLADAEANGFIRCRRLIAESGKAVFGYDQDAWAYHLHYHDQNTDDSLELFKLFRQITYYLLKSLPDAVWSNTIEHSERGTMNLDNWLELYFNHVPLHLRQMQDNYEAWKHTQANS